MSWFRSSLLSRCLFWRTLEPKPSPNHVSQVFFRIRSSFVKETPRDRIAHRRIRGAEGGFYVKFASSPTDQLRRTVDLHASAVLVTQMNIATTRGSAKSSLSLPNILTYARIAAIPVVVGCIYAQAIMDGPLWLRWVALAVFVAAGVTDFLDGYYARIWDQHSAFGRMLDPIADKLLVASCLLMLAGEAGDQVIPITTQTGLLLLWISAIFTIYTGWDYFRAGIHHLIKEDEG